MKLLMPYFQEKPLSFRFDGSSSTVFEPWVLNILKRWHKNDPVSEKEQNRNQQVFDFQGNRNPFIDRYPFDKDQLQ